MPKLPMLSLPLDLPDLRVLKTELTKQGESIITLESTLTNATCQHCGRTLTKEHARDEPILLRHLPILGRPLYIRIRPKRFCCPDCDNRPTTTQRLSWYDPRALHTIPYERHLLVQLVNSTIEDVVRKEDVSYDAVWACWTLGLPAASTGTVTSREDGLAQLQTWERQVVESGLSCFDSFLSTLANWRDLIANYFIAGQTSGFIAHI